MPFAFTVDVEGAWLDLPQEQAHFNPQPIVKALAVLENELAHLEVFFEQKIPVTWFFRCDDSVAHSMGCEEGLLIFFKEFIQRRKKMGDLFGLHPHFYKLRDRHSSQWEMEITPSGQRHLLLRAAQAWQRFFQEPPRLSRMGEAIMSLSIAQTLDEIGIQKDCTALSGRKRTGDGFFVDWLGAPEHPYRPCKYHYCQIGTHVASTFSFTEIPFSMIPIQASYDKSSLLRYFNLAYHSELIKNGLSYLKNKRSIVSVVHPHEIFSEKKPGELITFQVKTIKENIQNSLEQFGNLRFCTLSDSIFNGNVGHG